MKHIIHISLMLAISYHAIAQKGSAELMAGHNYLHYMHSLSRPLEGKGKFGWQHIATLVKRYQPVKDKQGHTDEIMNQAYLTYNITNWLSAKGGLFYTNVTGYKVTAGLQVIWLHKNGSVVISPRADILGKRSYEVFLASEYLFPSTGKARLMMRIQAVSNVSATSHNRSYQFMRVGVDIKGLQVGGGITLDEYGRNGKAFLNTGVFVRRKW